MAHGIEEATRILDGGSKFLGKREIKLLPELLADGEQVQALAQGTYNGKQGVLVATDQRLIFVHKGLFSQTVEEFPYGRVSSIQHSTGLIWGEITVKTAGGSEKISRCMKAQVAPFAKAAQAHLR